MNIHNFYGKKILVLLCAILSAQNMLGMDVVPLANGPVAHNLPAAMESSIVPVRSVAKSSSKPKSLSKRFNVEEIELIAGAALAVPPLLVMGCGQGDNCVERFFLSNSRQLVGAGTLFLGDLVSRRMGEKLFEKIAQRPEKSDELIVCEQKISEKSKQQQLLFQQERTEENQLEYSKLSKALEMSYSFSKPLHTSYTTALDCYYQNKNRSGSAVQWLYRLGVPYLAYRMNKKVCDQVAGHVYNKLADHNVQQGLLCAGTLASIAVSLNAQDKPVKQVSYATALLLAGAGSYNEGFSPVVTSAALITGAVAAISAGISSAAAKIEKEEREQKEAHQKACDKAQEAYKKAQEAYKEAQEAYEKELQVRELLARGNFSCGTDKEKINVFDLYSCQNGDQRVLAQGQHLKDILEGKAQLIKPVEPEEQVLPNITPSTNNFPARLKRLNAAQKITIVAGVGLFGYLNFGFLKNCGNTLFSGLSSAAQGLWFGGKFCHTAFSNYYNGFLTKK